MHLKNVFLAGPLSLMLVFTITGCRNEVPAPVPENVDRSSPGKTSLATPAATAPVFDHSLFHTLLQLYVTEEGKVNYPGFKNDPNFQAYLDALAAESPDSSWVREEAMAYWINAYNAFTIRLITDHYPIESITKIDEGKAWDKAWIHLAGHTYSLNDIEHRELRKTYKDARIHFAVNCASFSCPRLLNQAYAAALLENQLEMMTRLFLHDTRHNKIEGNKAALSQIFNWYKDDFVSDSTDLQDFINPYLENKLDADANISYLNYNWKLNE